MPRKPRDYAAEYARRLARAFSRGLSRSVARGHPKREEAGARGPPRAIPDARLQVALKALRDTGSLTKAAKAARIAPERLRRQASRQGLISKTGRKWGFSPDLKRTFRIFSRGRSIDITLTSAAEASLAGEYLNAVQQFLSKPNPTLLKRFEGLSLRDMHGTEHPLETDPNELYRLNLSGDHAAEQIYRIHV